MYVKADALNLSNREKTTNDHPGVVWLQGEDSCQIAVIGVALEHVLSRQGYEVTLLDHDQLNSGLCSGLTINDDDRFEYARRVAETAKLFAENNMLTIVIVDSLSPREEALVRQILQDIRFSSVYARFPEQAITDSEASQIEQCLIDTPIRPFIKPKNPELHIEAVGKRSEEVINVLLEHLEQRRSLKHGYSALASVRKSIVPVAVNEVPISIAAG